MLAISDRSPSPSLAGCKININKQKLLRPCHRPLNSPYPSPSPSSSTQPTRPTLRTKFAFFVTVFGDGMCICESLPVCLWQVGNSVTIAPNFMLYFGWQTNVAAYFQVNNFIKIMTSQRRLPSYSLHFRILQEGCSVGFCRTAWALSGMSPLYSFVFGWMICA